MSPGENKSTPPIDILTVAADAKYRAEAHFHGVQSMQSSAHAAIALEHALAEMMLASQDMTRAQAMMLDLARPIAELVND